MRIHESFPIKEVKPLKKRSLNPGTILAPIPAVLVSTAFGKEGELWDRPNMATFAWTGVINSDPPMVSLGVRPSRYTLEAIEATKEFVINLISEELNPHCDYCGVVSGRDIDKFDRTGLTPTKASGLHIAPAIAESPLTLSCRVIYKKDLGSHVHYMAEVVGVDAAEVLFDKGGALHLDRARLVSYVHGDYYSLGEKLGFFGYSVAKPDVLKRRMES